jgi:hypothetical protein
MLRALSFDVESMDVATMHSESQGVHLIRVQTVERSESELVQQTKRLDSKAISRTGDKKV